MAWTQSDIDALKTSIGKGERRVRFGDREVEYRSLDEMTQALDLMQSEVDGATVRPRQRLAYQGGKGL